MDNNSLRKKLIREVLDNDKRINNLVSQIQLRKISKDEARVLYTQLNKVEIQKQLLRCSLKQMIPGTRMKGARVTKM